jgi:two-component system, LytTR family, response regulator LytT
MNILIVEDDILIAEMIKGLVIELEHHVISVAYNLREAMAVLEENLDIDMAILDIQLGKEKSGFTIAQHIQETKKCPFIFLTSYADRSIIKEALSYKPRAYLMKPFSKVELYTTIEIIAQQVEDKPKFILIKDGIKNIKLDISDILWIKSDNVYLEVKTSEKQYLVRNSIDKFLKETDDQRLKRVHRSYAINLNKIESVAGQHVIIANTEIPISRSAKDEIISQFDED